MSQSAPELSELYLRYGCRGCRQGRGNEHPSVEFRAPVRSRNSPGDVTNALAARYWRKRGRLGVTGTYGGTRCATAESPRSGTREWNAALLQATCGRRVRRGRPEIAGL